MFREIEPRDRSLFQELDLLVFPGNPAIITGFDELLEGKEGYFIFNALDSPPAGYVLMRKTGETTGHLYRIGVRPNYQGRGFGSKLMALAIDRFGEMGINTITLYVEQQNEAAVHLYRKHGFKKAGTAWQFIAPWKTIGESKPGYECNQVLLEHVDKLVKLFNLEKITLTSFVEQPTQFPLMLQREENGEIVGFCRFTPAFPGCFPFILTDARLFDTLARGVQKYSLPDYDYCRFTFDDNDELAALMAGRGYKMHHALYKMIKTGD